jgi:AbrB family looped-hinge helix DNA binding protein
MTLITTVSPKGQIVIPKPVRDALGIKPRDRIKVSFKKGKIIAEPASRSDDFLGFFKEEKKIDRKRIKSAKRSYILHKFTKRQK